MGQQIAMKFCLKTHFYLLKPSDEQKFDFKNQAAPTCPWLIQCILKATQLGTELLECGCLWRCILSPPGEYDW